MEKTIPSQLLSVAATSIRDCKAKFQNLDNNRRCRSPLPMSLYEQRINRCVRSSALLETAASVGAAVVAVSVAATLLARTTKTSDSVDNFSKTCEDCGGSGICPECNGEGFILKKLTEESTERARMTAKNMATRYTAGTERARMTAKNMATRYTAGLPKKWSYCSKCSSSRLCITCDGSGRVRA